MRNLDTFRCGQLRSCNSNLSINRGDPSRPAANAPARRISPTPVRETMLGDHGLVTETPT